jgi:hypothetical protein
VVKSHLKDPHARLPERISKGGQAKTPRRKKEKKILILSDFAVPLSESRL